jgi:hypothetical protein
VSTCGTHDLYGVDLGTDTVVSAYTGDCRRAPIDIACDDDGSQCGAATRVYGATD